MSESSNEMGKESSDELGKVFLIPAPAKPGLDDPICKALWEQIAEQKGKGRCLHARQLCGYVHGLMVVGVVSSEDYHALFERLRLIEAEAWSQ